MTLEIKWNGQTAATYSGVATATGLLQSFTGPWGIITLSCINYGTPSAPPWADISGWFAVCQCTLICASLPSATVATTVTTTVTHPDGSTTSSTSPSSTSYCTEADESHYASSSDSVKTHTVLTASVTISLASPSNPSNLPVRDSNGLVRAPDGNILRDA